MSASFLPVFGFVSLSLAACSNGATTPAPPPAPVHTSTDPEVTITDEELDAGQPLDASSKSDAGRADGGPPGRRLAGEGEMCGGIAGLMCKPGLRCVMSGLRHPDQAGRCTK